MPHPKLWVPANEKEFRELAVVQGWTKVALGQHYGVSRDAIRRAMVKLGITRDADATWPGTSFKPPATPRHALRADTQGLSEFKDRLLADIAADTRIRARVKYKEPKQANPEAHALEVCLFDLHIGKLAWSDETGHDNYDSAIAQSLARSAAAGLLAQAAPYPLEQIIIPIGNDLMHSDSFAGTTTAGTAVDVDTRFQKMFRCARALMSWLIEHCASRAPVRAIIIPGNHDQMSAFCLGEVLAAEFKNDPRVTFDDSPKLRKYHLYGKNLIGFEHGKDVPEQRLVKLMPVEVPDLWAASVCREWHLGHLHKSKKLEPVYVDDAEGVTVRRLRSLSGVDAWHSANGFIGTRGAEGFVWRKAGGIAAHFFGHVPRAAA